MIKDKDNNVVQEFKKNGPEADQEKNKKIGVDQKCEKMYNILNKHSKNLKKADHEIDTKNKSFPQSGPDKNGCTKLDFSERLLHWIDYTKVEPKKQTWKKINRAYSTNLKTDWAEALASYLDDITGIIADRSEVTK